MNDFHNSKIQSITNYRNHHIIIDHLWMINLKLSQMKIVLHSK